MFCGEKACSQEAGIHGFFDIAVFLKKDLIAGHGTVPV